MTKKLMMKRVDTLALKLFRSYLIRRDEELFELAEIEIEVFDDVLQRDKTPVDSPGIIQIFRRGVRIALPGNLNPEHFNIKVYGLMNSRTSLYGSAIEYEQRFRHRSTLRLVESIDYKRITGIIDSLPSLNRIKPDMLFRLPKAHCPPLRFNTHFKENLDLFCKEYSFPSRYLRLDTSQRLFDPKGPSSPETIICSLLKE